MNPEPFSRKIEEEKSHRLFEPLAARRTLRVLLVLEFRLAQFFGRRRTLKRSSPVSGLPTLKKPEEILTNFFSSSTIPSGRFRKKN